MSVRRRAAIFFLAIATVVVAGAVGVRALRSPEPKRWPGRIALIGIDPDDRRQPVRMLAVADPVTRAAVVVPVDAVVEIPEHGFLRAYHAWRLGGADLVERTLGVLFGVDVPFAVWGVGDDFEVVARGFEQAAIAPEHVPNVRSALEEASLDWEITTVSGERRRGLRGTYLFLAAESVADAARTIGGLGTRVFADPEAVDVLTPLEPESPQRPPATPGRIEPVGIQVDVLNGGRVTLAATKTAATLRGKGYKVVKVGDFKPQNRPRSVVYFRRDLEAQARQVGADLGYPAEPLPSGIPVGVGVVVVLGHDAKV